MSDPDLDEVRRLYKFNLDPVNRCESCRYATPSSPAAGPSEYSGVCRLLGIVMANVRKSNCQGWQSGWGLPR